MSPPVSRFSQRLEQVQARIQAACLASTRPGQPVRLVAVSKRQPATAIRALAALGQRDFGESYIQEAIGKQEALSDLDICWHFVGPVQSNKTRLIASHFDWLHSLDRLRIARRLNDQRPDECPPLNVFIQVNVSGEDSKSGCTPAELPGLVAALAELPRLQLRGLMCLPEKSTGPRLPQQFALLRQLAGQHLPPDQRLLSMGMSADLEIAIAEGADIIRVGTDLFGPRPDPQPSQGDPA
jgi:pyridoxal phosphate enzyme (YggS family)